MPPEQSVPRVTAAALDVGHGVVVVVVLAVTLSLYLSLTCAATTVCLMVLPRCQFFSNLLEQFKTPFGAVLCSFPTFPFGKVRDFPKKWIALLACEEVKNSQGVGERSPAPRGEEVGHRNG